MDVSIVERETFWWAAGLAVAFPLLMLFLGELALRLRRKRRPIASTVAQIRNIVLPTLAAYAFLTRVVGLPAGHTAARVVDTLLWIAILHAALSFVDDVAFAGAKPGSWRANAPRLFVDLTRFVLVLVGGAIVLSVVWQLNLDKLATALGVGSLVIGLALQEPLGNVFAGLVLMFERPFSEGDWINVDGAIGRVVEINWRSVHLETPTLEMLVVPSAKLSKGNVSNYSRPDHRYTTSVALSVSGDEPPNKVRRLLVETAAGTPGVVDRPAPVAEAAEYGDGKIGYKVHFTVADYADLDRVRDAFLTRLWYASRREGLAVPIQSHAEAGPVDPSELLAQFPGFNVRDPGALADIAASAEVQTFGAGEAIVASGRRARGLHLVLSGSAAMVISDETGTPREVTRVGRGEFFGETSVLSGEPSEVTVSAVDDVQVIVLDSKALAILLDHAPRLAREIGRVMDARRKSTQEARALRATGS